MPGPSGILLTLTTSAMTLSSFADAIRSYAGRPVVDKTDLKGLFDIKLQFGLEGAQLNGAGGPEPGGIGTPSDPAGPSIFTAVQDLGLKLESAKGPLDIVVVDSAQKPSEN